jgi:Na+-transporting NADH:ubiquinone oxidoreductase subunit NqrC
MKININKVGRAFKKTIILILVSGVIYSGVVVYLQVKETEAKLEAEKKALEIKLSEERAERINFLKEDLLNTLYSDEWGDD